MYLNGGAVLSLLLSFLKKTYNRFWSQPGRFPYSTQWLEAPSFAFKAATVRQGSRLTVYNCQRTDTMWPQSVTKLFSRPRKSNQTRLRLRLVPWAICRVPLLFLLLALFALPFSAAHAASVDLEWDPNIESELAGYKIYWGLSSGNYTSSKDAGKNTTATISGLDEGETY
jgi:hypothetical protein